ncbi:hypothetical protein ACIBG8_49200 [Nonomuraea sp. NPDC050556]|uniref:hypothetical protein n=1 Tax=Nonomuraea sp. NPDC050556 TaxID=3364369 RepID=UPI0037880199
MRQEDHAAQRARTIRRLAHHPPKVDDRTLTAAQATNALTYVIDPSLCIDLPGRSTARELARQEAELAKLSPIS